VAASGRPGRRRPWHGGSAGVDAAAPAESGTHPRVAQPVTRRRASAAGRGRPATIDTAMPRINASSAAASGARNTFQAGPCGFDSRHPLHAFPQVTRPVRPSGEALEDPPDDPFKPFHDPSFPLRGS
jgi:hypothetical protein